MSKIYINIGEIKNINSKILPLGTKLGNVRKSIKEMMNNMSIDVGRRHNISQRMGNIYKEIGHIEMQVQEVNTIINLCLEQYAEVERQNTNNAKEFE